MNRLFLESLEGVHVIRAFNRQDAECRRFEKANEDFGLHLPENDEYQTIGGLILHEYQSFPKVHEIITIAHFKFKIIKVTATKIELVKLKVEK